MPANASFTEIITTTLDAYRSKLTDNVMRHNPLLAWIKDNGNTDPAPGGNRLLENLMIGGNGTIAWYSGYEVWDTSAQEVLTSANFDWKQLVGNVTMSGLEEMQNAGPTAQHNLYKARIKNLEIELQNTLSVALFYSNTENDGKSIGGLQHLVSDTPSSGTVGGIDRSANTFWRNQVYDFSDNSVTASKTTIVPAMNKIWRACLRGSDKVDLIIAGDTYFDYFEQQMQEAQRFTGDTSKTTKGFNTYRYKDADVVYDPNCSATRMYMLTTKYLHYRPHSDRNLVTMAKRDSINQDAFVVPVLWGGNMTCSNAARQGVITA